MNTVATIVTAVRAYVATLAPSRNALARFLEHKTNEPFASAPVAGGDGFEISVQKPVIDQGFGLTGAKRGHFTLLVKLGHADAGKDIERENYATRDIARVADLVEGYQFPTITEPDVVDAIFYMEAETDKTNPNWWITTIKYDVYYAGPIETA